MPETNDVLIAELETQDTAQSEETETSTSFSRLLDFLDEYWWLILLLGLIGAIYLKLYQPPVMSWLLLQWLRASAWINGRWGWGSIGVVVIPLVSLAANLIPAVKESEEKKEANKYLFCITCIMAGLVLALFTCGAVYKITLVPPIVDKAYAKAAKMCDDFDLNLAVADRDANNISHVEFQFPAAWSIISTGADVFKWDAKNRTQQPIEFPEEYLINADKVDSLFLADGEEYQPMQRSPNSTSAMRQTLQSDNSGILYEWIKDRKKKPFLWDGYWWLGHTEGNRVRVWNYMHIKSEGQSISSDIRYRKVKVMDKERKARDKWIPYCGYKEEIDDEGNEKRWDYIGFNSYKYIRTDKSKEPLYDAKMVLNKEGKGTYECNNYEDNTSYKGKYSNNAYNGKGKYTYADGSVYKGKFVDGRRNGKGVLRNKDGKVIFRGEWKDNERWTGKSKNDDYVEDCAFTGNWLSGKWDGHVEWIDNTAGGAYTFSGKYKNGKRDGYGEVHYANGFAYEGYWKDDKKNGRGKERYSDNSVYDGEWKNGAKNGYGNYILADGSIIKENWVNGEKIK